MLTFFITEEVCASSSRSYVICSNEWFSGAFIVGVLFSVQKKNLKEWVSRNFFFRFKGKWNVATVEFSSIWCGINYLSLSIILKRNEFTTIIVEIIIFTINIIYCYFIVLLCQSYSPDSRKWFIIMNLRQYKLNIDNIKGRIERDVA